MHNISNTGSSNGIWPSNGAGNAVSASGADQAVNNNPGPRARLSVNVESPADTLRDMRESPLHASGARVNTTAGPSSGSLQSGNLSESASPVSASGARPTVSSASPNVPQTPRHSVLSGLAIGTGLLGAVPNEFQTPPQRLSVNLSTGPFPAGPQRPVVSATSRQDWTIPEALLMPLLNHAEVEGSLPSTIATPNRQDIWSAVRPVEGRSLLHGGAQISLRSQRHEAQNNPAVGSTASESPHANSLSRRLFVGSEFDVSNLQQPNRQQAGLQQLQDALEQGGLAPEQRLQLQAFLDRADNDQRSGDRDNPLSLFQTDSIRVFVDDQPGSHIGYWIEQLSEFACDLGALSVSNNLSARIESIIQFFENHPGEQVGLNNIASVSTTDCHDGAVGGLVEMEKHIGSVIIKEKIQAGNLTAAELRSAAQQYFTLENLEAEALAIGNAGGSEGEAVELQLFLMHHLGSSLGLPLQNRTMRYLTYADGRFALGAAERYGAPTERLEESALLSWRLVHAKGNIDRSSADSDAFMKFMVDWAPTRDYLDFHRNSGDQTPSQAGAETFDYLDIVSDLAVKDTLDEADRVRLEKLFDYFAEHEHYLPESNRSKINSARSDFATTNTIQSYSFSEFSNSIGLIRDGLIRAIYRDELSLLFEGQA